MKRGWTNYVEDKPVRGGWFSAASEFGAVYVILVIKERESL